MKELQVFQSSEFGTLEVLEIERKPYFSASACASILGYTNPRKAIRDHCREDGVTFRSSIDSLGRTQQKKYIAEGNLYRLIVNSKLPKAQEFERWIFDCVVPALREHGRYGAEKPAAEVETVTAAVVETVRQLAPILAEVEREAVRSATRQPAEAPPEFAAVLPTALPAPHGYEMPAQKRALGIIDGLPVEIRQEVEEMICSGQYSYKEIIRFLSRLGIKLSAMSIHRYKKSMGV